jgi:hypothetical protein
MQVYHWFYNVSLDRSNNRGNTWTWLAPPAVSSLFYPPVEVSGATVAIGRRLSRGDPFATGLPNALAADLLFHKQDRMLFCGTRNRGVWVINIP